MNLESLLDGGIDVIFARCFAEQDVDWESSTRNGETGSLVIEVREL